MKRKTRWLKTACAGWAALLLAACAMPAPVVMPAATPAPPTVTPTPTAVPPTATPVPPTPIPTPPPSPVVLLETAMQALEQEPYHFAMEVQSRTTSPDLGVDLTVPYTFQGDFEPPDRIAGRMSITMQGVPQEMDMIVMGSEMYAKSPDSDAWREMSDVLAQFEFDPTEFTPVQPADYDVLELVGREVVDGVPVFHLKGIAPYPASALDLLPAEAQAVISEIEGTVDAEYWIGEEDGRMVKAVANTEAIMSGEATANVTGSITARYSDYGVPVSIAVPEVTEVAEPAALGVRATVPITVSAPLLPGLAADTPDAHLQRGLTALSDGRVGLALAHFDQVVSQRPDWPDGYLYRAATLAIDSRMDEAMTDLDQAIDLAPERADAYTLRAWAALVWMIRDGDLFDAAALDFMAADLDQALALQPAPADARQLQAVLDLLVALGQAESGQAAEMEQVKSAIAGLEAMVAGDPGAAAGTTYFTFYSLISQLGLAQEGWLQQQLQEAGAQMASHPESFAGYARRGLARLIAGSMSLLGEPDLLQEADGDLLQALALVHANIQALADPAGGPLQVARMWNLKEASYILGSTYLERFFALAPERYPEFAAMLSTYWELLDQYHQVVDDPIVFAVAFSPDGSQIATVSESGPSILRLWDAEDGTQLLEVELPVEEMTIATTHGTVQFSPDGRQVLVAYTNPKARIVDTGTGETVVELAADSSLHAAAFDGDGARVVTNGSEGTAQIWDAATGEVVQTLPPEPGSAVQAAAFSPDGRLVVGAGDPVHVWDAETGDLLLTLPGYEGTYLHAPAVSPDSRRVAVPGDVLRIYDLQTGEELLALEGQRAPVLAATFSPDGTRLATASEDGTARIWDAETGELQAMTGHAFGIDAVAFSPDGTRLATGGPDGRLRVWDAATGQELWNQTAVTLWWQEEGVEEE